MLFYLDESSNKKNKRYLVYLNVSASKKRFSKCLVTSSLKQSVKNKEFKEEWFRKEITNMEESTNKKQNINSLPVKIGFSKCLVTG